MRERQPCLPLLSITSLDHSLSQIQRVKVDASCLSLQMRLALLILCLFKCVKDANGFNDTVFKDLDVEGMVEDAHDPFDVVCVDDGLTLFVRFIHIAHEKLMHVLQLLLVYL